MSTFTAEVAARPRTGGRKTVRICAWLLLLMVVAALAGPAVSPHDYETTDFGARLLPPSLAGFHWFGTDDLGRDLFARTFSGMRVTLGVAVIASLVSLVLGVSYGVIAGYAGGKVDAVMMRTVDGLYALPFIFLVILLMVAFERNFLLIFVAIGAINWLDMARIVRGQTLSLKQRDFIAAATVMGAAPVTIVVRHIVPNLLGIVAVYMTLTIPQAILVESFLSFLGLGVQAPQTSLGALVNDGVAQMERAPWLLLIPGSLLSVLLLCFNFLGDGLRDVFDPRQRSSRP